MRTFVFIEICLVAFFSLSREILASEYPLKHGSTGPRYLCKRAFEKLGFAVPQTKYGSLPSVETETFGEVKGSDSGKEFRLRVQFDMYSTTPTIFVGAETVDHPPNRLMTWTTFMKEFSPRSRKIPLAEIMLDFEMEDFESDPALRFYVSPFNLSGQNLGGDQDAVDPELDDAVLRIAATVAEPGELMSFFKLNERLRQATYQALLDGMPRHVDEALKYGWLERFEKRRYADDPSFSDAFRQLLLPHLRSELGHRLRQAQLFSWMGDEADEDGNTDSVIVEWKIEKLLRGIEIPTEIIGHHSFNSLLGAFLSNSPLNSVVRTQLRDYRKIRQIKKTGWKLFDVEIGSFWSQRAREDGSFDLLTFSLKLRPIFSLKDPDEDDRDHPPLGSSDPLPKLNLSPEDSAPQLVH